MIFFTDRDLGAKVFPGVLRKAGLSVEIHRDHFASTAPDEEWLPEVARRGWIILTSDENIQRRVRERDALMHAGAAVVVVVGGSAKAVVLAQNFVNSISKVNRALAKTPWPFIAKLYRPNPASLIDKGHAGTLSIVLTAGNWRPGRR